MDKKVIKLISIVVVSIFLLSFLITSLLSKDVDKKKEIPVEKKKEITLLEELKNEKNIKISMADLKDVSFKKDSLEDFYYYLDKSTVIKESPKFEEVFTGQGNKISFSTDCKNIKISKNNKVVYYKIPTKYEKMCKELMDKEIYTSFNMIKNYKDWDNVEIEYNGKPKKISNSKLKEVIEKVKEEKAIDEHEVSKINQPDYEQFYINIYGKKYNLNVQTISNNVIGIYYNEYTSYYKIDNKLYNYLCGAFNIEKEENKKAEKKTNYDWVESVEIHDIVNNIDETVETKLKEELLNSLFSEELKNVKFDTYEVKRYTLKLKGNNKTEKITIYENHILKDNKYYKINGADLKVDDILNQF